MDEAERKAQIKKIFDTVAEGYGSSGMEFFHHAAAQLPGIFHLRGNEQILDIATGTGIAATTLASHVPRGKVVGIDLSEAMLAQAKTRAQDLGIRNIELHSMDMQNIGFADGQFDAANCSFGIFFLPDMASLLRHIASKVKAGGQVVASTFYEGAFQPNVDLFLERIQGYGVTPPELIWKQICTEEKFRALYQHAGLVDIHIQRHDIGYYLKDAETWWRVIWYAGFRGLVAQLSTEQLAEFKRTHLAEIASLKTEHGIPLNVTALFANGRVG